MDNQVNNVVPLHNHDKILDEASLWLTKLDEGLTHEETQALKQWLRYRPHQNTFLEMAKLWDNMEVLSKLADLVPPPRTQKRVMSPLKIAASFALVAILGVFVFNQMPTDSTPAIAHIQSSMPYNTKVGEQREVQLADGSRLVLNTNTHVVVTYTDHQRLIELAQGEIHIDVAKDKARPLNVIADGQMIQAVGTAFNVQWVDNNLDLIVTEGRVRVAAQTLDTNALRQATEVRLPVTSMSLTQGQQSYLSAPEKVITRLAQDDINADLSWRAGKLVFRGEPLSEVIAEVSRYTNTQLQLADPALGNIQVAGLFNTQDLDGLLTALAENFHLSYQRNANNTVLINKAEG